MRIRFSLRWLLAAFILIGLLCLKLRESGGELETVATGGFIVKGNGDDVDAEMQSWLKQHDFAVEQVVGPFSTEYPEAKESSIWVCRRVPQQPIYARFRWKKGAADRVHLTVEFASTRTKYLWSPRHVPSPLRPYYEELANYWKSRKNTATSSTDSPELGDQSPD